MNASPHQKHRTKPPLKKRGLRVLAVSLLALLTAYPTYAQQVSQKAQTLANRIARSGVTMQINASGQPVFVTKNVTLTLTGNQTHINCTDPIDGE